MNINKKDILMQADLCIKCEICQKICPAVIHGKYEFFPGPMTSRIDHPRTYRGFRGIKHPEELEKVLYRCMICQACTSACPYGIDVERYIIAARADLDNIRHSPFFRKLTSGLFFLYPELLGFSIFLIKLYQRSGFRKLLKNTGILKLAGLEGMESLMPDLPLLTASKQLPEINPASGRRRFRVGFFLSCGDNWIYPQNSISSVNVLSLFGCEVIIPKDVRCCGMPSLSHGQKNIAMSLAQTNMDIFKKAGVDFIITDCATCGSTLSNLYLYLFDGTDKEADARNFSSKVWDISQFLVEILGFPDSASIPLFPLPSKTVTYHDPCHLSRGQGGYFHPREILKGIPGISLKEMQESDLCCGGAGTYNLSHYDTSMRILHKKVSNIIETDAELVATGCPGCSVQLQYGMDRQNLKKEVIHPIVLLSHAMTG